jgi:hypothetical protein
LAWPKEYNNKCTVVHRLPNNVCTTGKYKVEERS